MSDEPVNILVEDADGVKEPTADAADGEGDTNEEVEKETEEEMADLKALKAELEKITVSAPTVQIPEPPINQDDLPDSYKDNLPKEKLVLAYAENFRRQYVHLYRDRKPLFLNPLNECSIEKFVCTTIRSTQLPYNELYNWDGASEFVADYLNFEPLNPPTDLPKKLYSPTTALKNQKGNCFDYSSLLCSLLIAVGYDAYVVSGYATREVCLMDETRETCPLLTKKEEAKEETKEKVVKKYTVKPPKDLSSKYEKKMAARKVEEKEAEETKRRKEEEDKEEELEKPPTDDLYGLRIHSWVLILKGKREVAESFFIEPFTGLSQPLTSVHYLGIECIWNNQNYWVNMQDCSLGVKLMKYDLGDCTLWEFMFPTSDKPILAIPDVEDDPDFDDDEDAEDDTEKHLDMPSSWVEPISLSKQDFEMRCPKGKKTKIYKKSKLEKFAPYINRDGLEAKLWEYDDRQLKELKQTKEFYSNRKDKLHTVTHNNRTGWVTEYYYEGRGRCLKNHTYKAIAPGPENERTMVFYHEARVNGLVRREETSTEMVEHFIKRDDCLFYRHVLFGKRPKKFVPADTGKNDRPILKITERYHRNKDMEANEDINELIFNMQEEKIQITYHTEDTKISSSTREFIKPHNADEKGATLIMTPDMHSTFQIDPTRPGKKQVTLYQAMVALIHREEQCKGRVRESEDEVKKILDERTREKAASELDISVYDTERNEKAKKHRKELERQQLEEKMRRQDMELDYLAPFLAQLGDPSKLSRKQAAQVKEDCLADLKARLIDKANLIQARFEKETAELEQKQNWYQQNKNEMQPDDVQHYVNYCKEATFKITILDQRLLRHKEQAPTKYLELDQKLRNDERLSELI